MSDLIHSERGGLVDVVERILDRGLVLNADIAVSIAGTEILGIKLRATLASFETAARYGLEFPTGTNFDAVGWKEATKAKARCPECGNRLEETVLVEDGCPFCGWSNPSKALPWIHREDEGSDAKRGRY